MTHSPTPEITDAALPALSVVIATFNRAESLVRLLTQLGAQTLPADAFEVVVVDDGSAAPVRQALAGLATPYRLRLLGQTNAGPAAARHHGITAACGEIIVVVDDDMRVDPSFLAEHLAEHPIGTRRMVLGRMRADPQVPLRLFERLQLAKLDALAMDVQQGRRRVRGTDSYTGNVSFRRADYLDVGGFDPELRLSEDAELGIRLERAGVELRLSEAARSLHLSDHTSVAAWARRAVAYGHADSRVAHKHPEQHETDPWRFLFEVHPVSRPWMLLAAIAPPVARPIARTAIHVAMAVGALGLERVAVAGATFAYGLYYFVGVRREAGTLRRALGGLGRQLNWTPVSQLGDFARIGKAIADSVADHRAMRAAAAKYGAHREQRGTMVGDAIHHIGFQMMLAYRLMRLMRDLRFTLLAKLGSRMIRHVYAAELHWDAELAPGVMIVHGNGLVISHAAKVGTGCVLFQHVTLGESMHPETREVGAPVLEPDVHVGVGAVLLGPITIGRGTKIGPQCVLTRSVPAGCVVEPVPAVVQVRGRGVLPIRPGSPRGADAPSPATPAGGRAFS